MTTPRARLSSAVAALLLIGSAADFVFAADAVPGHAEALLARLVGRWTMKGTVRGEPVTNTLTATRTLQGRFVELHMLDAQRPPGYEARVFVGVDPANGRLIAHWMDSFGAAYSVPTATGEARGDTLELLFPYPDGAFRDRFVHDRSRGTWDFHLEAADSTGAWSTFARYAVRHVPRTR